LGYSDSRGTRFVLISCVVSFILKRTHIRNARCVTNFRPGRIPARQGSHWVLIVPSEFVSNRDELCWQCSLKREKDPIQWSSWKSCQFVTFYDRILSCYFLLCCEIVVFRDESCLNFWMSYRQKRVQERGKIGKSC
jgi:hypothetical protein